MGKRALAPSKCERAYRQIINVSANSPSIRPSPLTILFFFSLKDSPGWDGGRSNGFVNGYHDNRTNGGFGGRGPPRNDRGGRSAYRGNRGGGSFNQPMQNAGGDI